MQKVYQRHRARLDATGAGIEASAVEAGCKAVYSFAARFSLQLFAVIQFAAFNSPARAAL